MFVLIPAAKKAGEFTIFPSAVPQFQCSEQQFSNAHKIRNLYLLQYASAM